MLNRPVLHSPLTLYLMRTPEQINAALDQVRKDLQSPAFWERVEETKRGVRALQEKAVIDRSKLHRPVTI